MLYNAVLWTNDHIPGYDDFTSVLSLDAIKAVVDKFEPVPVVMRGLSFQIGSLTEVKLSGDRNILEGTIDMNDVISDKLSGYDIYAVVALVLKEDPKAEARPGSSMSIGHVVLQTVHPNILIPPIEQINS